MIDLSDGRWCLIIASYLDEDYYYITKYNDTSTKSKNIISAICNDVYDHLEEYITYEDVVNNIVIKLQHLNQDIIDDCGEEWIYNLPIL